MQALVKLFTDLGGEIRLNAEIAEIETRGGEVKAIVNKSGQREEFDLVASNADVFHTYDRCCATRLRPRRCASGFPARRTACLYF